MTARLIDSTNKMMLMRYAGQTSTLVVDGQAYFGETFSSIFHTSAIIDYEMHNGRILYLYTLNSTYTFEIITGIFDVTGIRKIDDELIRLHCEQRDSAYKKWWCQIEGPGFLDNVISSITLPSAMKKSDAELYIMKHDLRDDQEGCFIKILLSPLILD